MKRIFFGLLLISFLSQCHNSPPPPTKLNEISFILNKAGIPIIKGKLNGKDAYFILDSGSSTTLVDKSLYEKYKFQVETADSESSGIGGTVKSYLAIDVKIEFGENTIEGNVRCLDLSAVRKSIKNSSGIEISGLIGTDVFNYLDATIDYKNDKIITQP
jgi:hypothetical protein